MKERPTAEPRESLKDSEKKARSQPENFKERATDDKVVEIGPVTTAGDGIKGIDPKQPEPPVER